MDTILCVLKMCQWNDNSYVLIEISQNGPVNNKSALVQVMACHLFGAKPLPEPPLMTQFTDAYVPHQGGWCIIMGESFPSPDGIPSRQSRLGPFLWFVQNWQDSIFIMIIKMLSCQYKNSRCGDKMIVWPSYLHYGISYTGEVGRHRSVCWIKAQASTS